MGDLTHKQEKFVEGTPDQSINFANRRGSRNRRTCLSRAAALGAFVHNYRCRIERPQAVYRTDIVPFADRFQLLR
jgi:hypothetical protein